MNPKGEFTRFDQLRAINFFVLHLRVVFPIYCVLTKIGKHRIATATGYESLPKAIFKEKPVSAVPMIICMDPNTLATVLLNVGIVGSGK